MDWDFPSGQVIKNQHCDARDVSLIPGKRSTIPHAAEQRGPHTATSEPTHHNWRVHMPQ